MYWLRTYDNQTYERTKSLNSKDIDADEIYIKSLSQIKDF